MDAPPDSGLQASDDAPSPDWHDVGRPGGAFHEALAQATAPVELEHPDGTKARVAPEASTPAHGNLSIADIRKAAGHAEAPESHLWSDLQSNVYNSNFAREGRATDLLIRKGQTQAASGLANHQVSLDDLMRAGVLTPDEIGGSPAQTAVKAPGGAQAPQGAAPSQPAGPPQEAPTPLEQASFAAMQPLALPPLPGSGMYGPGTVMKASAVAEQALAAEGQLKAQNAAALASKQEANAQEQRNWLGIQEQRETENRATLGKMLDDIRNTNVEPEHFWADKSGLDRLRFGLGMLASGVGSALTGQPNLAADFVQRAIARDVEAQRANLGKKQSVYSYYLENMKDQRAAQLMAHSVLTNAAAAEMEAMARRGAGTEAAANMKVQAAQLHQASITQANQASAMQTQNEMQRAQLQAMQLNRAMMMQWMRGGSGGAGSSGYVPSATPPPMMTEFSPKGESERQEKYAERRVNLPELAPALGPNAHTLAPTPAVAQELNKTMPEFMNMEHHLKVMEGLGKQHNWAINSPLPNEAEEQFGVEKNALNLSMNRLMEQNRFTDTEQGLYKPMIADPKKFLFGSAGQANINALRGLIQSKRIQEYQRLGVRALGGNTGPRSTQFTPAVSGGG